MRLRILDGFRTISILVVLLFHFYSRFFGEFYTYVFNTEKIFAFGHLGVQFFFIISGFVIYMSVEKCDGFLSFMKKRYIRLAPGMLIASLITFSFFNLLSADIRTDALSTKNFLFSNTFLSPSLIHLFNPNSELDYTDGAYWSLWVEVCFYILFGLVYFFDKKNVVRNFTIVALGGYALSVLSKANVNATLSSFDAIFKTFNVFKLSLWFLIGIYFNRLYFTKNKMYLLISVVLFGVLTMSNLKLYAIAFNVFIFIMFMLFFYKSEWISFLGSRLFSKCGIASYTVYLLHQNIGVLIIYRCSPYLGKYNFIIGLILIPVFFLLGHWIYKYFEKPIGERMNRTRPLLS